MCQIIYQSANKLMDNICTVYCKDMRDIQKREIHRPNQN